VPRLKLMSPPDLGSGAKYPAYKPWLLENFFDHLCSYCLLRNESVQVDHYEPQGYRPERADDPRNLLLGCPRCNGRAGKSDYHPDHARRTRLPGDRTGFLIIDVRADDFAKLFEVTAQGTIRARPGPDQARAAWNIPLLKLDLVDQDRKFNMDLLDLCERAAEACEDAGKATLHAEMEKQLELLVPELGRRALFFEVFGIAMTPRLLDRLRRHAQPEPNASPSRLV
jgi:hypothetical protein